MTAETVKHKEGLSTGRFYLESEGKTSAVLQYNIDNEVLVIEHTVVNEGFEGKGLGKLLVEAAIKFARAKNMKVLPQCPYARKVMERSPEYQDLMV